MSLQTRFSKVLNNLVIRKHILLTWVYEFRALILNDRSMLDECCKTACKVRRSYTPDDAP